MVVMSSDDRNAPESPKIGIKKAMILFNFSLNDPADRDVEGRVDGVDQQISEEVIESDDR